MKNWTISKRITFGFTILTLLAFIIGMTGYISLSSINTKTDKLINDSMPGALILGQVKDNLSRGYGNLQKITRLKAGTPAWNNELNSFHDRVNDNTEQLKNYEAKIVTNQDRAFFDNLKTLRTSYMAVSDKMAELATQDDVEKSYAYMDETFYPEYSKYRDALQKQIDTVRSESLEVGKSIASSMQSTSIIIISSLVTAILLSISTAFFIIRGTNKVLNHAIVSIDEGSSQVASASSQVSAASNMLAEGASEQAASLEETSSSLEEMSSMTAHNASSATQAKTLADEMHSAADDSAEHMRQMQSAMDSIKESSTGISQIIKTIDEIAFQTNILALNAAVEAARAGEAGAGFAVVAEEVRNLAQRSAQSAKETSAKIEGAIRNSDRGVAISAKVAESLNTIVDKARSMNSLVAEIANASLEQDKGIGQLTIAVQEMDKVTQANASNAEETASASEELNAHADSLKETVMELITLVRNDANSRKTTSSSVSQTNFNAAHRQTASFKPAAQQRAGVAKASGKAVKPNNSHFLPMHEGEGKDNA